MAEALDNLRRRQAWSKAPPQIGCWSTPSTDRVADEHDAAQPLARRGRSRGRDSLVRFPDMRDGWECLGLVHERRDERRLASSGGHVPRATGVGSEMLLSFKLPPKESRDAHVQPC